MAAYRDTVQIHFLKDLLFKRERHCKPHAILITIKHSYSNKISGLILTNQYWWGFLSGILGGVPNLIGSTAPWSTWTISVLNISIWVYHTDMETCQTYAKDTLHAKRTYCMNVIEGYPYDVHKSCRVLLIHILTGFYSDTTVVCYHYQYSKKVCLCIFIFSMKGNPRMYPTVWHSVAYVSSIQFTIHRKEV